MPLNENPTTGASRNVKQLLSKYVLFSHLSAQDFKELSQLMIEVEYKPQDKIVIENDFVDAIYFIIKGAAEVTKMNPEGEAPGELVLATLKEGDAIGLTSLSFYSTTGRRTATVTAKTDMILLRLDIPSFHQFIKTHPQFDTEFIHLTEMMLKLDFVKRLHPFAQLSNDEIYSIASQIQEIVYPERAEIFKQNDIADCCYLLRSGNVEIFLTHADGTERHLAVLEPPQLFGEAAFLTTSLRNASARALSECRLLKLENALLEKLLKNSKSFSQAFIGFMVNRFAPSRNEHVIVHRRIAKNKREIITLHNTELDKYYHLTEQSWFIWQQLDGIQTIEDLTMAFFKKYQVFIPEIICNLLYGMAESGFVIIPAINSQVSAEPAKQTWGRKLLNLLRTAKIEYVFTQVDPVLTKLNQLGISLLFTKPLLIFFSIFIISTIALFVQHYAQILTTAANTSLNFWVFILLFFPVSFMAMVLHEAGHAFAAKKLGYKIQRIGVGWVGLSPVAFTDTSPLWLAGPHDRLYVDSAGVFVDCITAGILVVFSYFYATSIWGVYLWLLSLLIYFNAFKNLSMITEYDGYHILSDILDFPRLRKSAVSWLVHGVPLIGKYPGVFKMHLAEVYYWIACFFYMIFSALFVFLMLQFFFKIFMVSSLFGIPLIFISLAFAGLNLFSALLSIRSEILLYIHSKS